MKLKVALFDKTLLNKYYNVLSVISVIASFIFLVYDIPDVAKLPVGIAILVLFLLIYIFMWILANGQKKVTLNINNSLVEIYKGDLFSCDGFKVIAFNEYFDTHIGDGIVSLDTINGKYIQTYISDPVELDSRMEADSHLQTHIRETISRPIGKNTKYAIGTVFKNDDYLLLAFSKFDNDNRAYLKINDYIHCLMNFWEECDIYAAGKVVSMPLLGTGITRFKGYENVTEQELLELILWTFQVSKVQLRLRIVLTDKLLKNVDLYNLKAQY